MEKAKGENSGRKKRGRMKEGRRIEGRIREEGEIDGGRGREEGKG